MAETSESLNTISRPLLDALDQQLFDDGVLLFSGTGINKGDAFRYMSIYRWTCAICSDFVPILDTGGHRICFDCVRVLGDWYKEEVGSDESTT